MDNKKSKAIKWDVFISHASEDKEDFIKELAKTLSLLGVKVWYDEFTLKIGDSLSKSIDYGLKNSDYGIIVISHNFIKKGWTEYELRSLINKEIGYKKIILPIWHKITKQEVKNFSPFLADKFALNTTNNSIKEIVIKLVEVIRPDIHDNLRRHLLYEKMIKEAKPKKVRVNEIFESPIRHDSLSTSLINRIKIIHQIVGKFYESTLDETINDFKRDIQPEREIEIWELIVLSYLEIINKFNIRQEEYQHEIFKVLLGFSMGEITQDSKFLNDEMLNDLIEIYNNNFPL